MTAGYTGKILRLDLTNKATSVIDTEQYEAWMGGTGMATAIWWDLVADEDKTVLGLDPKNTVVITNNCLTGTLAPDAGRTEIAANSPYCYPTEWFSRSNAGSRFGPMLKQAGWDGIVIEGASDTPVWINIINDKAIIEDATDLWGQDSHATRDEIWLRVTGRTSFGDWQELGGGNQTTQGPCVLAIGPAGETLSRLATIQCGPAGGFSQGGFGAVLGSKNLKAISVLGTGSIIVADPGALLETRNYIRTYGHNSGPYARSSTGRISGCYGCGFPCKTRRADGLRNDSQCMSSMFGGGASSPGMKSGGDFLYLYGFNAFEVGFSEYIYKLYQEGIIGPGTEWDTTGLPFDQYGSVWWAEAYTRMMANREGLGDLLTEGTARFAATLGRWEEDTTNGWLDKPQWGYEYHWSTPDTTFAYCSLLDSRDVDDHCFTSMISAITAKADQLPCESLVNILSQKTSPYTGDPYMFDFGLNYETGIYSEHRAKLIAWIAHYYNFYKQSLGMCDWVYPDFLNPNTLQPGVTGDVEHKLINAVTGSDVSFEDGMEKGRRVFNLKRAIYVLQGRERSMEKFRPYFYDEPSAWPNHGGFPTYQNGEWVYDTLEGVHLDEDGVESFKTHFYTLEGWDTETGWPTRETLEELDLGYAADTLESAGKLGS